MAHGAIRREAGRGMRRIVGGVVVFHVTCVALSVGAGQVVVAIHVALQARHGGVEPGQGPSGTGVIESSL